jgi:Uma2 family endonuclease
MTLLNAMPRSRRKPKNTPGKLRMTEAEFVAWADEDVRAEWVDGDVIIMSPVSDEHASLVMWLLSVTAVCVEEHDLGIVRGSEFTARFAKLARRRVPDLMFIDKSRRDQLQPNHYDGAPDLIMEVVSPDSLSRDWREKYLEYEKAGVREYWIIDPLSRRAEAYALTGRKYRRIEEKSGVIRSTVIRGFWLKTAWLWPDKRPAVLKTLRELGVKC